MRKAIFVDVGESAWIAGELKKLRSDLAGHIEIIQPDTTAAVNGSIGEWLIKKAAQADFVVFFYTVSSVPANIVEAAHEATTITVGAIAQSDVPVTDTQRMLRLTRAERAMLPDHPMSLVVVRQTNEADRLPDDLKGLRRFDLSSPDGHEALLCRLVHEPVSPRSRLKDDAASAAFKVVMGAVATLVGSLDKTRDFLIANFNETLAVAVHHLMVFAVCALLCTGLFSLFRFMLNLMRPLLAQYNLEDFPHRLTLWRSIALGVATVVAIAFGGFFSPRPPRVEAIINKHHQEWAQRLESSQLFDGGMREHHDRGVAQVWSTAQSLSGLLVSQSVATMKREDIQKAFQFIDRAQITQLKLKNDMKDNLAQQAALSQQRNLSKLPDSFPTFAWMLHTIARIQGKEYLQPEITQLLEQNRDKYSTTNESPEGWGYYDYFEWGVTEVTAWVGLALIQSLRTEHPKVWITQEERDAVKKRVRDIMQLLDKRQIPNVGGYSPINDVTDRDYIRTYSTIMVLWLMAEAALPELEIYPKEELDKLHAHLKEVVDWLGLSVLLDSHGWKVKPANPTDEKPFLGLTAQTLFILNRVPSRDIDRPNRKKFTEVKQSLLTARECTRRNLDTNDRIHDADRYLYPTQYVTEGSTFLWYPWCVGLMRSLSTDPDLNEKDHKMAARSLQWLRSQVGVFGRVVESEYNYVAAEALIGFNWPLSW